MKSIFSDTTTTNDSTTSKPHFKDASYLELGEKRDGSQDLGTFNTIRGGSESDGERQAPLAVNGTPFGGIVKSVDMKHSYRSNR